MKKAKEIIKAIEGSGGIKTMIARRLGVHRNTINQYLQKYPSVQAAYEQEVEMIGDLAESVILNSIQAENLDTAKWYARVKLKDRGYSERTEISGGGQPLEILVKGYVGVSPDDWPDKVER